MWLGYILAWELVFPALLFLGQAAVAAGTKQASEVYQRGDLRSQPAI